MAKVMLDESGHIAFANGTSTLEQLLLLIDLQTKLPELLKELSEKYAEELAAISTRRTRSVPV